MKSPGDSRLRKIARVVLPPLVFAIVVLTLWQLYAVFGDIKESSLPKPTQVAQALWENREMLIENAWVTIKEILLGFTLAIITGVSMALLIRSSKTAERAVYPAIDVSKSVSRVMTDIAAAPHLHAARVLRRHLATYEENRDLVLMGAYRSGSDPEAMICAARSTGTSPARRSSSVRTSSSTSGWRASR